MFRSSCNSELLDARIPQNNVGKLYDRTAWFYDAWAILTESKAQKRALDIADIQDSSIILDVAVGTGSLFKEIVKQNPNGNNYGIDISQGMLEKAKSKLMNKNIKIIPLKLDLHLIST